MCEILKVCILLQKKKKKKNKQTKVHINIGFQVSINQKNKLNFKSYTSMDELKRIK